MNRVSLCQKRTSQCSQWAKWCSKSQQMIRLALLFCSIMTQSYNWLLHWTCPLFAQNQRTQCRVHLSLSEVATSWSFPICTSPCFNALTTTILKPCSRKQPKIDWHKAADGIQHDAYYVLSTWHLSHGRITTAIYFKSILYWKPYVTFVQHLGQS